MSTINYRPSPFRPQADNSVAVVAPFPNSYVRGDGTPSQAGDVYSLQPDGTWQVRSADEIGPWEKAQREGVLAIYTTGGVTRILMPVQE